MAKSSRCLIVRHSERIDEVDLQAWFDLVNQADGVRRRDKSDHSNDPILTENGHRIAEVAGATLKRLLLESPGGSVLDVGAGEEGRHRPTVVYCSRLRRCVETAHRIALALQLPLVVSKGLALTAKAVEDKGGSDHFGFLDLAEIRAFCPGVDVYSADAADLSGPACTAADAAAAAPSSSTASPLPPSAVGEIPTGSWHDALASVARRHPFSLIVAHRESVRNLAGIRKAPYCCMAMFDFDDGGEEARPAAAGTSGTFNFAFLLDNEGNRIQ